MPLRRGPVTDSSRVVGSNCGPKSHEVGLRNVPVAGRRCVFGGPLPAGRPRTTCSDACKQASWRRQRSELTVPAPARPSKPFAVYERPEREARQLDVQLCELCRTFIRRSGYGGISSRGEPVIFEELLGARAPSIMPVRPSNVTPKAYTNVACPDQWDR
jgi:hypothetical protein